MTAAPEISTLRHGVPAPLGAPRDGQGVNFALFSEHAREAWTSATRAAAACATTRCCCSTAYHLPIEFALPQSERDQAREVLPDRLDAARVDRRFACASGYALEGRSLALLRLVRGESAASLRG